MAIVDSLKKLLVKFGGNPSALEENATSSDVIDAITEAYTDKEGTYTEVTPIGSEGTKIATITTNNTAHDIYAPKELPAVTSEDNGKVLGVVNGVWDETNLPTGNPKKIIVEFTRTGSISVDDTDDEAYYVVMVPISAYIVKDENNTVLTSDFDGSGITTDPNTIIELSVGSITSVGVLNNTKARKALLPYIRIPTYLQGDSDTPDIFGFGYIQSLSSSSVVFRILKYHTIT